MKFDATLMKCVRNDIDCGLIPMLLGEPGIGKSSWLMALADIMRTQCFVLPCNQLADKADLTGARLVPVVDANGNTTDYKQVFYPHAIIHDAIEYAVAHPRETPILFLDELNRTTPDVTSEALSIPTLRAIGSKKLPDNLRVVTAGNDKGNITALDEASISRFALYHVEPDTQTFLGLDPELNIFVKNVLQAHPEVIFGKTIKLVKDNSGKDDDDDDMDIEEILDDGEEMAQITTPRTITGVSRWLNTFSNQELLALLSEVHTVGGETVSMLQEAIEGHVGKTNFAVLLYADITQNIMNTSNQVNVLSVAKPSTYDAMKQCGSMTDLNSFISNMTEDDRSGSLLYALYEKADNTIFIQALSSITDKLNTRDMKTLMRLAASDDFDGDNVSALLDTHSPIADRLSVILNN